MYFFAFLPLCRIPYCTIHTVLPRLSFCIQSVAMQTRSLFQQTQPSEILPQCSKLFWFPFPSALEHVILVSQIFHSPDFRQYLHVRDVRSFLTVANCHSKKSRLCFCPLAISITSEPTVSYLYCKYCILVVPGAHYSLNFILAVQDGTGAQ
jgi:hypothetical protein